MHIIILVVQLKCNNAIMVDKDNTSKEIFVRQQNKFEVTAKITSI